MSERESSPSLSARSVARGAAVNLLGEALNLLEPLLFILVSRIRGAADLGLFMSAVYVFDLLVRLGILGFDKSALRYVPARTARPQEDGTAEEFLGFGLRAVGLVSLGIAALALAAAAGTLYWGASSDYADTAKSFVPIAVAIPLRALSFFMMSAVRGRGKMRPFVVVHNLLNPASFALLCIPVLVFNVPTISLSLAFAGGWVIAFAASVTYFKREFPTVTARTIFCAPFDKAVLGFSVPQGMTEMMNLLLARADSLMIAFFFPTRPEFVAYYSVAASLASFSKKVRGAFDTSFAPLMSELLALKAQEQLLVEYRRVGRWIHVLFDLLGMSIVLGSPFLLSFYGKEYVQYWFMVPLLVAARLFNVSGGPAQSALLMGGRSKLEFANNLAINIVNVGLNAWLIPRYGVYGAAWATTTSLTVFNIVRLIELRLLMGLYMQTGETLRICAATALAAAPGLWVLVSSDGTFGAANIATLTLFLLGQPTLLWALGLREEARHLARKAGRLASRLKAPVSK
jgi:O-antigen/teichoic acid export membrane protein